MHVHLHIQLGKFRRGLKGWPQAASLAMLFLQGCLQSTSLTLLFLHLFKDRLLPFFVFCMISTVFRAICHVDSLPIAFLAITDIVFLSFTYFFQLVCEVLLCFCLIHTLSSAHLEIVKIVFLYFLHFNFVLRSLTDCFSVFQIFSAACLTVSYYRYRCYILMHQQQQKTISCLKSLSNCFFMKQEIVFFSSWSLAPCFSLLL